MHNRGAKKAVIQRFYNYLYFTILDIIFNNKLRDNGVFLSRSGAAKSYSSVKERIVL
jgi:hypothetical protein